MDTRKDNLEGYSFLAGYRHSLNENLSVHAGLGFGLWISQQEVLGEIGILAKENPSATVSADLAVLGTEGLNYIPAKRAIKPVVSVGSRYLFGNVAFAEANVRFLQYDRINYVPLSYTGKAATTETTVKGKATFDVAVGFRF